MPWTVICRKNRESPRVTVSSTRCGILRIKISPNSWGKLKKCSRFRMAVSSESTNLADISRREPPHVWHIIGVIRMFLWLDFFICSTNRSSRWNFMVESSFVFVALLCRIERKKSVMKSHRTYRKPWKSSSDRGMSVRRAFPYCYEDFRNSLISSLRSSRRLIFGPMKMLFGCSVSSNPVMV